MKLRAARTPASTYLPRGLPHPMPMADGLDAPYWEAAKRGQLTVQRCTDCRTWRWGPEWICPGCRSFAYVFEAVAPQAVLHSWARVRHQGTPVLRDAVPYLVVVVCLPQAGGVRMIGNLLGNPHRDPVFGQPLQAVFESHRGGRLGRYCLVQWRAP